MTKKIIKKLAEDSYKGWEIDPEKVRKITKLLKREDLKEYIKYLKLIDSKKKVTVLIPTDQIEVNSYLKNYFTKTYPQKKVKIEIDPSLIAGIKVIDYDNIYEFSIKSILENSISKTI